MMIHSNMISPTIIPRIKEEYKREIAYPAASSDELLILYPDESLAIDFVNLSCDFCKALLETIAETFVAILIVYTSFLLSE